MEPSSPASKGVSRTVFAIVAIVLLIAGLGAGYLLGRPSPAPALGPVDGLLRSNTFPRVDGWYRNREVFYFDEGANSPANGFVVEDAPIYAFFHMDGTSVAGQQNVIDVRPGDPGYSDLWRLNKVIVGPGYMGTT